MYLWVLFEKSNSQWKAVECFLSGECWKPCREELSLQSEVNPSWFSINGLMGLAVNKSLFSLLIVLFWLHHLQHSALISVFISVFCWDKRLLHFSFFCDEMYFLLTELFHHVPFGSSSSWPWEVMKQGSHSNFRHFEMCFSAYFSTSKPFFIIYIVTIWTPVCFISASLKHFQNLLIFNQTVTPISISAV